MAKAVIKQPVAAPYAYGGTKNKPVHVRTYPQGILRTREEPAAISRKMKSTSSTEVQFSVASLYDYVDWGAAGVGATRYQFFGRSIQGAVTNVDTNMPQANNVGAGNKFIVEHIWVLFKPGVDYVSNGSEATLAGANAVDDFKAVMSTGFFQFFINGLPQCGFGISPLQIIAAPQMINIGGGVGAGVTALQALAPSVNYSGYNTARFPFELDDQQNFSATIEFPSAVTLPSANATSKIGIILWGRAFRMAG